MFYSCKLLVNQSLSDQKSSYFLFYLLSFYSSYSTCCNVPVKEYFCLWFICSLELQKKSRLSWYESDYTLQFLLNHKYCIISYMYMEKHKDAGQIVMWDCLQEEQREETALSCGCFYSRSANLKDVPMHNLHQVQIFHKIQPVERRHHYTIARQFFSLFIWDYASVLRSFFYHFCLHE